MLQAWDVGVDQSNALFDERRGFAETIPGESTDVAAVIDAVLPWNTFEQTIKERMLGKSRTMTNMIDCRTRREEVD